jgi:hypothetical protein
MNVLLRSFAAILAAAATLCAQEPSPSPAPAPKPTPAPSPAKPQPSPTPSPTPAKPDPAQQPQRIGDVVEKVKASVGGQSGPGSPKKKAVAEVVKNCDAIDGLFRIYRDRETGAVHLYVRKDQLEREFIYFAHVVDGIAGGGRYRGQFGDSTVFVLRRKYEKLEFVEQNTAFYFDPQHPLARAAGANVSHALLASEPIEAYDADGYLLNANSIFLKETLRQVKPSTNGPSPFGKLSESKTQFTRLKSFPHNALLAVEYVFDNPSPPARNDEDQDPNEVADPRYVSVTMQHTFIAMPENGYQPRMDDPRVGYFMTELTDQTSTEPTPWRDFIHRWDLRKKDPAAAVSEPLEPITWWIENTTPYEFRPIIREAALRWNSAFERVGFKGALVVQEQPDNANWDSDDIDHNVLRWTSSPKPPFGGYGPSFVNPRTGQILGSDIMLEFAFVKNRIFARRLWSDVGLAGQVETDALAPSDPHACAMSGVMQQGLMLGGQMLRLRKADQVDFDTLLRESMSQLILHELGHTLGLNHNFRASQVHAPAELQDRALTERTGLSGSVMDYMPLNLGPDKAHQGQFYINAPGPYDDWAIQYGYSVADADPEKESKRLAAIAARSHEPQLAFANDADDMRSSGKAIDPRAMIYDMSSDAVAYGADRCKIVRQATAKLLKEYSEDGRSWQELLNAYLTLTTEQGNALTAISRYIGGVYVERPFAGQVKEHAPSPLHPVEADRQRAAMQTLAKYAFAADAWTAPHDLVTHLQQQRRGFDFRSTGEDPKLHERSIKIQSGLLDHLMHGNTQNRILDSALYGNGYPLTDVMHDLTDAIASAKELTAPVNTLRQNLQHEYLSRLISVTKNTTCLAPARGIALHELRRLEAMFQMAQINAPEENKPHIEYVLFRIKQTLEPKGV